MTKIPGVKSIFMIIVSFLTLCLHSSDALSSVAPFELQVDHIVDLGNQDFLSITIDGGYLMGAKHATVTNSEEYMLVSKFNQLG